uniref:Reverse transcriptase Ty1/copia-type domain-containing protein n=1 Tax=Lactuca sativa TaxID=4236 RepID=A0A9R1UT30_LACSA|nr:hypothetical protein LSAT_V11C800391760 [Lactuca sativa]
MSHKLAPRSIPCIFMGYCSRYKGYRCLDPVTSRIYITCHSRFDECIFPFYEDKSVQPSGLLPLYSFLDDNPFCSSNSQPIHINDTQPTPTRPCGMCSDDISTPALPVNNQSIYGPVSEPVSKPVSEPFFDPVSDAASRSCSTPTTEFFGTAESGPTPVPPCPPAPSHPMQTRAKSGIFKPKYRANFSHTTRHALFSALFSARDPKVFKTVVKSPHWFTAMQKELDALYNNNNWTLFPRPTGKNVVGSKWLFRTKYRSDGTIERHKARLVAQRYSQIPGLNFSHTFSPVVKASIIRVILALVVLNNWGLHQLDVNNVFLHGQLTERVYMEQPPGFVIHGNQPTRLTTFVARLSLEFAIKDLGSLTYFLGLEVNRTDDGLFLSQSKYAREVLQRADLLDARPVHTPLATTASFSIVGEPCKDPSSYRSLVGALQYLNITRPDIPYAVNQVSQFLQTPTTTYLQHVKRILQYVKGTVSYGPSFIKMTNSSVLGYSDVDWAHCLETRRSTYGYSIFLGGNLISWSAKKQPTVSRSSFESEYRAMATAAAEIIWLTNLLRELRALLPDRPTLLCDNQSALFMIIILWLTNECLSFGVGQGKLN